MGKSVSKEKRKPLRLLPSRKDLHSQGNTSVQNAYQEEQCNSDATSNGGTQCNSDATSNSGTQCNSHVTSNCGTQIDGGIDSADIKISMVQNKKETENIYSEPDDIYMNDAAPVQSPFTDTVQSPFTDRLLPSLPTELDDNKHNAGYEVPRQTINPQIRKSSSSASYSGSNVESSPTRVQQQNPLQTLMAYGFDKRKAQEALTLCDDDLVQAISYLHNTREHNPKTVAIRKLIMRPSISENHTEAGNEERNQIIEPNESPERRPTLSDDISPEEHLELLKLADAHSDAIPNPEAFDCPTCWKRIPMGDGMVLRECLHTFCRSCVKHAIMTTTKAYVQCPYIVIEDGSRCQLLLQDREIHALLAEKEFEEHINQRLLTFEKETNKGYHCKSLNCSGFYILEGNPIKQFKCSICGRLNCMLCQNIHEDFSSACPTMYGEVWRSAAAKTL